MEQVRWERKPEVTEPLLMVAFEGWNDAGDAASIALGYLCNEWEATPFASIDPEEFYDFTCTRPQVRGAGGLVRQIEWPSVELLSGHVDELAKDVVLLRGVEPQLRWRTFCRAVVEMAGALGVESAMILGALLADVPHTRPVKVSGTTEDRELAERFGLGASDYEGPTGITGVLHHSLQEAGIPAASFWAAVPHYVHQVPSPKAALALVRRSADAVGAAVNPLELQVAAEEYERQVSERVADDEEAAAYVAQLEEADDTSLLPDSQVFGDPQQIADEAEHFLRRHTEGE